MSLPSLQLPSLRSLELPTLRYSDALPSIRTIAQDHDEDDEEQADEGYDFSECRHSWFSESSERGRWLISPIKKEWTRPDVLPSSSPLMRSVSPLMSSSPQLPSSSPLMPSSPLLPSSPMMSSSPELSSSPMPPTSDDGLVPPSLCYSTSPPSSPYAEVDELAQQDEPPELKHCDIAELESSMGPASQQSSLEICSAMPEVSIDLALISPIPEPEIPKNVDPDQTRDSDPVPSTSRLSDDVEHTTAERAPTKSKKRRSQTKDTATTKSKRRRTDSPSPLLPAASAAQSSTPREELTGMLMECMATSRASSLEVSKLYTALVHTRPSLKLERSHDDWISTLNEVLVQGQQEFGCFDMVESSGRDEQENKSWTEPKWYYVPEQDPDQERAGLLKMMMPRAPKRRTTMKYKQYYWKPLDKISKWDDEDAL